MGGGEKGADLRCFTGVILRIYIGAVFKQELHDAVTGGGITSSVLKSITQFTQGTQFPISFTHST